MTLHLADGREAFIDFREKMSRADAADRFLRRVDPDLIAGVPGTVAGLEMAREIYGVMARAELVAPAIAPALATEGFLLDQGDVDHQARQGKHLKRLARNTPGRRRTA